MKHRIPAAADLTCVSGEPRVCYARWRASLESSEGLLLVDFEFVPFWQTNAAPVDLVAIYCVRDDSLQVAVTDQDLTAGNLPPGSQFLHWKAIHRLVSVNPACPVLLEPVTVAKPWGRELWYTGIEQRAVCHFVQGDARSPIPWLRAALPADAAGAPDQALVLLKMLDPLSAPVLGDLYFELHEHKREVYIVTHIDPVAWPGGVGYIRYGFDPEVVAAYSDEGQFRRAYLAAVQAYEVQRRAMDSIIDSGNRPSAAHIAREASLRETMDRFTHLHPLRVGDVLEVPLRLPHALQHGVRVVEFQSATYERKILSFGQKVLTQAHWDTADAVAQMLLASPPAPAAARHPVTLEGVLVESLAKFPDFEVFRVTVQPGFDWNCETKTGYCLVMVIGGLLELMGGLYEREQALLLPRAWAGRLRAPEAAPPLVFLLARPRP